MTDFVKFIEIENIDFIKKELKNFSNTFLNLENKDTYGANFKKNNVIEQLPSLHKWLLNFKEYPIAFKFYYTPPGARLNPHIDGSESAPVNWGINIPVANYQDGETFFYHCDKSNIYSGEEVKKIERRVFRVPKDETKLDIIKSYLVDKPCIISTNVMHSASNYGKSTRIILLIRWPIKIKRYEEILK